MKSVLGRRDSIHGCVDENVDNAVQRLIVIDDVKLVTVEVQPKARTITVEPIILGTTLCQTLSAAITVDLSLRQACYNHGSSMNDCSANSTIENESHKIVANIQATSMIIAGVIPVLFCLVIGPWSDTNGRKPFLCTALFGQLAQWVMYAALASIENLNPMVLIAPAFCLMLTGGHSVVSMLTFCYLSDAASESNKAFRMGIGMTGGVVASCIGPLLGNWIYNGGTYYGYIGVYVTCSSIQFLIFLYAIFGLPESVRVDKEKREKLFKRKHILGIVNFFGRKRPVRQIILISLIIVVICISSLLATSEFEVYFLSLKKKLQWDIEIYSRFTAVFQGINCGYMTLGIWFFCSFLRLPDSYAMAIAFVAHTVGMVIFATSNSSTGVYVANVIGVASKIAHPIYRSMFANAVNPEETGSAMTVATVFECLTIPLWSMLYAKTYGLVVSRNPFEVYYLPAAAALLGAIIALGIRFCQRKDASND